jgi:hypothetical protein
MKEVSFGPHKFENVFPANIMVPGPSSSLPSLYPRRLQQKVRPDLLGHRCVFLVYQIRGLMASRNEDGTVSKTR